MVQALHSDSTDLLSCCKSRVPFSQSSTLCTIINNHFILFVALNEYPVGCMCMKSTALFCDAMNLTDVPEVSSNVTMLYLERNRIQLTNNSLVGLNLTHRL